jgi:hypothetical protein
MRLMPWISNRRSMHTAITPYAEALQWPQNSELRQMGGIPAILKKEWIGRRAYNWKPDPERDFI